MAHLTVATCQFPVTADPQRNAQWVARQMRSAKARGAHVAHFPECALSGYAGPDLASYAGYDWQALRAGCEHVLALARELRLWLVVGSAHRLTGKHKPHNSLYVVNDRGALVERYDKRFCAGDRRSRTGDLAHFTSGNHLTVFELRGMRCGAQICHDYRYPELYRASKRAGVELMFHSFHAGGLSAATYRAMQAQVGRSFERINSGSTLPEITMPAAMITAAADNHVWISCANSSRMVTVLDAAGLQPDCNANGKLDLCDLLTGNSKDLDNTGVPDECEPLHTVWHVDASAPGGGNGSAGAPFQTLSQAFLAAQSYDSIEVADGIYSGPGNRNLQSSNRNLTLRSVNGPGTCIVDVQHSGSALNVSFSGTVVVEGITFLNASQSAIIATNDGLEVSSCTFQGCSANSAGGAIYSQAKSMQLRDCRFVGNDAVGGFFVQGGGAVFTIGSSISIEDCIFKGNSGKLGGALYFSGTDSALVARCLFLGNMSATDGGGVFAEFADSLQLESCLFAGNTAVNGGAVADRSTLASKLALNLCTLVSNQASSAGGGLYQFSNVLPGGECLIADSILWDNVAPQGAQAALGTSQTTLDVRFSDVEGGSAAVSVAPGGTLLWGAGNLNVDPSFADPDGPDNDPGTLGDNSWRLGALSPCIDAGSNPLVPQDAFDQDGNRHFAELTPFDLDDQPRRLDDPAVPDTGVGKAPIVDLGAYEKH